MASRVTTHTPTGSDLSNWLQQQGGRISKAINDAMQDQMKIIQKECIDAAPVDEGALENAIKLHNENRRRTWVIYVDESMPDDTGRYTVGDYAMWLHEGLLGSTYNLGPKSIAKEALTGKPVGPKYLERPFQEAINNGLIDKIAAASRAANGVN